MLKYNQVMAALISFPKTKDDLMIQGLTRADLNEIANWPKFADPLKWANFNMYTQKMQDSWMVRNNHPNITWFVIRSVSKDQLISRGSLILPEGADEVILGIVLRPDLLDQGLGTKVVHLICSQVFMTSNFNSIWLETKQTNLRARAVWKKLGFQSLGTHYRKESFGKYALYVGYRLKKEDLLVIDP